MSWHDAVADIAARMEEEAKASEGMDSALARGLHTYAVQLRLVLSAAVLPPLVPPVVPELPADEKAFHRAWIEAIKRKGQADQAPPAPSSVPEEAGQQQMVEVQGGGADATLAAVDAGMPAGAHLLLGAEVYTLQPDGVLHHNSTETLKYQAQRSQARK